MDTPPPSPPPSPPPAPPPTGQQIADEVTAQAKGFLGSLLDFSFTSFITPKLVKLLYFLMLLGVAAGTLAFLVASIMAGGFGVVMGLVGAPIMLVLGAVFARVYVEVIMLAFKMLETLKSIESKQK